MATPVRQRTHRAFPLLVCASAVIAVTVGALASPPRDVPTYALDSIVVYKCEVALALFLASYLLLVATLLAMQGRTIGKISTTGFDLPSDLSTSVTDQQVLIDAQKRIHFDLAKRDQRLSGEIDSLWEKLDRSAHERREGR